MRLDSLKVYARGSNGWGSSELTFAKSITQLYGPNGSGKTPLVQSIAFCLGYPCEFRDDIYVHCESVELTVSLNGKKYKLKRQYSREFDIQVLEPTSTKQRFFKEGDYSRYLFEVFGYEFPHLVTNSNTHTHPYLSTILPIFYLDQDIGYTDFYKSPGSNFIRDQFSEAVRICVNLPSKNSFDKKKSAIDAKKAVERLDNKVHRLKGLYEDALNESESGKLNIVEVDNQINSLKAKIEELKSSKNLKLDATDNIDRLLSSKMTQVRLLKEELDLLESKCASISTIRSEIEVEINTLSLNEEARRVFKSFADICSVDGCGLFLGSSESYGKNLLYLKDQIKDLEISSVSSEKRIEAIKVELETHLDDIETLNKERENAVDDDGVSALVESIHISLSEIVSLEIKKRELENISVLEEKYMAAERERDNAISKQESLSSGINKSSIELIRFQSNLKSSISNWKNVINTKNVSDNIDLYDGFKASFGGEKLNQIKGSTKLRVVLAYHAALFEQIVKSNPMGIRFLILDTPRQHDISAEDLDQFIKALKVLADENNVQVVFSTTEYKYESGNGDKDWLPSYDDESFGQTMYLGK